MLNNYSPEKTVKFIGYSAEEVGLLGSNEIAKNFKANAVDVKGVLQFDMTNFNGSSEIGIISDYTNAGQNTFLAKIIDEHLKISWKYTTCGYACSDHASWNKAGYPASFPFESLSDNMNRNIHTIKDTLEISRGTAIHSTKFAKIGIAYILELVH